MKIKDVEEQTGLSRSNVRFYEKEKLIEPSRNESNGYRDYSENDVENIKNDGPAWIGYVKTSKSKKTIYFNDHAFQKNIGNYANYIDIENGDKYWISGLKKEESNRHWAGHGKIMIDRRAVNEYLFLIGEKELPLNLFEVVDIEDRFPVKRVKELLNEKK